MTRLSLADRGRQIQAKLASGARVPPVEAMVNSGRRRTEAKRLLLARLRESAEGRGELPAFTARY